MAGDWIKMRVDLADDPAVIGMSELLKTTSYEVVGRLHGIWSWADKHAVDGFVPHISERWIDKYVEKNGFAKAMRSVSWLIVEANGVTFPNFSRHNGDSAKARAENMNRARLSRKLRDKTVTKDSRLSQESRDEFVTREEKRREESKQPIPIQRMDGVYSVDKGTGEINPFGEVAA